MKYSFSHYDSFGNYMCKDYSGSFPHITDKLIRLTAKLTERFASDIYYELNELQRCGRDKIPYDKVLLFRENGVNSYQVKNGIIDITRSVEELQWWGLEYNPETNIAWLRRVCLRQEEN